MHPSQCSPLASDPISMEDGTWERGGEGGKTREEDTGYTALQRERGMELAWSLKDFPN